MKGQYDAYQAKLSALPVVRRFAGNPQLVTSLAPLGRGDEIRLAVIER
jgi:hypothetical protein